MPMVKQSRWLQQSDPRVSATRMKIIERAVSASGTHPSAEGRYPYDMENPPVTYSYPYPNQRRIKDARGGSCKLECSVVST